MSDPDLWRNNVLSFHAQDQVQPISKVISSLYLIAIQHPEILFVRDPAMNCNMPFFNAYAQRSRSLRQ